MSCAKSQPAATTHNKETFVHIAYLDDSGSDRGSPIAVVSALLVSPDIEFRKIGSSVGSVVQDLIPENDLEKFEEFHAFELYHGDGAFKNIDEPARFKAIKELLSVVATFKLPIIYSAVDKKKLAKTAVGGAIPIDVAFRMCALGFEDWMSANDEHGLGLLIMDDTKDKELRNAINHSFQILRSALRPPNWDAELYHIHDDMYFGDSRYSFGIQLIDLCTYFIVRNLKKHDDEFYRIISSQVICSKAEPDWTQLKGIFLEHSEH